MMAVLWTLIYGSIALGLWVFFKVTDPDDRERWKWNAITAFVLILIPVWVFTELVPFVRSML